MICIYIIFPLPSWYFDPEYYLFQMAGLALPRRKSDTIHVREFQALSMEEVVEPSNSLGGLPSRSFSTTALKKSWGNASSFSMHMVVVCDDWRTILNKCKINSIHIAWYWAELFYKVHWNLSEKKKQNKISWGNLICIYFWRNCYGRST